MPVNALLIIPTYNEVENLAAITDAVWRVVPTMHILVVDDNSQDGTKDVIAQLSSKHPERFNALHRAGKLGLGTAYLDGFRWSMEDGRSYDACIEMDADFSHDPQVLRAMLTTLETSDVVVGSRYITGGGTVNWSPIRKLISRFGSLYARMILGVTVRDLTGGYNGWRQHVLKGIQLDDVRSEGYSFQIELKYRALRAGFSLKEIPIIFSERRAGHSKMSSKIVLEAMLRVWQIRWLIR